MYSMSNKQQTLVSDEFIIKFNTRGDFWSGELILYLQLKQEISDLTALSEPKKIKLESPLSSKPGTPEHKSDRDKDREHKHKDKVQYRWNPFWAHVSSYTTFIWNMDRIQPGACMHVSYRQALPLVHAREPCPSFLSPLPFLPSYHLCPTSPCL